MRSEKDEIARLKAENIALQQKLVSTAESLRPAAVKLPASDPRDIEISTLKSELAKSRQDLEVFKKTSLEEIKMLSAQSIDAADALAIAEEKTEIASSLIAENELLKIEAESKEKTIIELSAKIECINTLKIRNTFLESENALLSERVLIAEALSR